MSIRQKIKRHIKIISLLKQRSMSFEELQDQMSIDPDCLADGLITSQRTFQRDIKDIASIYGIEISSDRSTAKYHILEDTESEHTQRLRENFEVINAIRLSNGLENKMLFEKRRPLGTEHMAGLLHAIQNHLLTSFEYQKFWDGSKSSRKVKPVALKEARNRWYLIAQDEKDDIMKNFSLDRMTTVRVSYDIFRPIDYNTRSEFEHSFGIINGTEEEPTRIVLSFTPTEGRYIRSLPLHHSQELVLENDEEIRFSYFIRPTYDLRMEILSYGDQVRVIEPLGLRNIIKKELTDALRNYRDQV